MDEIPRYRKKKSQASKSSKRADHKHEYVKSITMLHNPYNPKLISWHWTTNCKICGRQSEFEIDPSDDFRKPEYKGRRLFYAPDMFLSPREILEKFRDFPIYTDTADKPWEICRMSDEDRERYISMGG